MTAPASLKPVDALARPTAARLPLVGGVAACLTLALAMLVGSNGPSAPVVAGTAVSFALLAAAFLGRTARLARTGAGLQLAVAVLALGFAGTVVGATVVLGGGQLAFAAWGTLIGALLVGRGLTRIRSRAATTGSPWQRIAGGAGQQREAQAAAIELMLVFGGGIVLVFGLASGWGFVRDRAAAYSGAGYRDLAYLAVAVGAALFVIAIVAAIGWAIWRAAGRSAAAAATSVGSSRGTEIVRDEPTVAAHLHDSVLQTLALIGRAADDSARVQQLARQQERSLRAWLAGRDEPAADSLVGAVKLAAQEVEDEQPGARIEVVAVGDAPFDRSADAMVRAAREAMRNAVRHAGSPVRVFVEVDGTVREMFVRDAGPGFDLAQVDEGRRGVRDAIIGRMEHVGGTATIDSGEGGTEVALRCDAPTAGPTT